MRYARLKITTTPAPAPYRAVLITTCARGIACCILINNDQGNETMPVVLHLNKQPYKFSNRNIDKKAYMDKINHYRNECGCRSGALFMFIALLGLVVHLYINWNHVHLVSYTLGGLLFICLSMIAGKLFGMAVAKIKLSLLYKSLIEQRHLELIE
jgi:hypothetical protein